MRKKAHAFEFQPFSTKQRKLLFWWEPSSPVRDHDMVIADGSIRSGKTIAMLCSFLRWSFAHYKEEDFIIAGKSMGALKRNVVKPMQQILQAWSLPYSYNRSENYSTVGGNTYCLFGANNEASQDVLQGLTAAGALADETALFPRSFVDQMIARCSRDGAKVFMNCNPRGPSHWFKKEFIDLAKEKHIYYLHFQLNDNNTLSESVKERYMRMYTGVFFRRYILGEWAQAEGSIYTGFDRHRHVWSQDKLEAYIEANPFSFFTIGVDFGGSGSASVFTLVGFTRNFKKAIVLDEYYDPDNFSADHLKGAWVQKTERWKAMYPRITDAYLDHEMLLIKSFRQATPQIPVRYARKLPIADRISATDMLMATDKLVVMENCKHLIEAFESAVWDARKPDELVRLDNGTVNIDSLDSFEYATEKHYRDLLRI